MNRSEWREWSERLLAQARLLHAAFPNADAMQSITIHALPHLGPGATTEDFVIRRAMSYLRDEMLLVRDGKTDSLTVLADEMASLERLQTHADPAGQWRVHPSHAEHISAP
jgi:hypothetical protein